MELEQLVANLIGLIRRETLNGREHLIAPLSLLVPGVLNGSQGPLFYPQEEIAKNVEAWNNIPIVVYHPTKDGKKISAREPDVLDSYGIGTLFYANTSSEGKLKAEGWFDVEKTRKIDNRVLIALERGEVMELSTGLFTTHVPAMVGATHNNTPYEFIARNYRPDHLAILPDLTGACSVDDGCGVNVNTEPVTKAIKENTMNEAEKKTVVDGIIANCDCWSDEDRETLNGFKDERLTTLGNQIVANVKKEKGLEAVANAAKEGFEDQQGDKHTFNVESGKWETKKKPAPKKEPEATPTGNTEPKKPITNEEWLEQAPEGIRSVVTNAMALETEQKQKLSKIITANKQNVFSEEQLMLKDVPELNALALLAKGPEPEKKPHYLGSSPPTGNTQPSALDPEDILELPTINWKEEQK